MPSWNRIGPLGVVHLLSPVEQGPVDQLLVQLRNAVREALAYKLESCSC